MSGWQQLILRLSMKIQSPKSKHCRAQVHFQSVVTEATSTEAMTAGLTSPTGSIETHESRHWFSEIPDAHPKLCNTHTNSTHVGNHSNAKQFGRSMYLLKHNPKVHKGNGETGLS